MAKDAHDREDLLRDATGYTRRIELRVAGVDPTVFCGFRRDGSLSVYWGQDDVIQFNSSHELRRAFHDNRMLASHRRRLHWLNRAATARTKLSREELPEADAAPLLALWEQRLRTLLAAMSNGTYEVLGQVPAEVEVTGDLMEWFANNPAPIRLALQPGAG